MRLEELFELVVELREGGSNHDEIGPADIKKSAKESAQLLRKGVEYAFLIATFAGILTGISSVLALTAGDGTRPINVLYLIAVTMLLPIGTLTLSLFMSWRLIRGKTVEGPIVDLGLAVLRWGVTLAAKALDKTEKATQLKVKAALGVFRGDYEMLEPVVPWIVRRLTQRFSVALSLGFILTLIIRLTGTDLTFGWQSTGEFMGNILPGVLAFLSAPFAWMAAEFHPSQQLVEATRFVRFSGAFNGGEGAAPLSSMWVPFLIAGAIFWGVVPRLFTIVWYGRRQSIAIQQVLKDWAPVRALQKQLDQLAIQRPEDENQPLASDALAAAAKDAVANQRAGERLRLGKTPKPAEKLKGALLLWQHDTPFPETVRNRLTQTLNFEIAVEEPFGNRASNDADTLRRMKESGVKVVVMHVEPFSPPGQGFVRQIGELREALGDKAPIIIELGWWENGVRQPLNERQVEVWTQSLQKLADRAIRWHISESDSLSMRANDAVVEEEA